MAGTLLALSAVRAQAQGVAAYAVGADGWVAAEVTHAQAFVSKDGANERISYLARVRRPAGAPAKELIWIVPIGSAAGMGAPVSTPASHLPSFRGTEVGDGASSALRRALGVLVGTQVWTLVTVTPALFVERSRLPPAVLDDAPFVQGQAARVTMVDASHLETLDQPAAANGPLSRALLDRARRWTVPGGALAVSRFSAIGDALEAPEVTVAVTVSFPVRDTWVPWLRPHDDRGEFIETQVVVEGFLRAPVELNPEYYVGTFARPGQTHQAPRQATLLRAFPDTAPTGAGYTLQAGTPGATARAAWLLKSEGHPWLIWAVALAYFVAAAVLAALLARSIWPTYGRPSARATMLLGLANLATALAAAGAALFVARRERVSALRALAFVAATSVVLTILVMAAAVTARSLFH